MFEIANGRIIQLSRGDTGAITFEITDTSLTSRDLGVFTLKKRMGTDTIMRKILEPDGGGYVLPFVHEETAKLEPGYYEWDFRIAFDADLNYIGDVVGGGQVITVVERGVMNVVRTVGDV